MAKTLWDTLTAGLDEDERLVLPEMYVNNPQLYDKIVGIAYLIKERNNPEAKLDWVWENALARVTKNGDVDIKAKQLVVRIRLPWNDVKYEWTISQAELEEHRKDYTVIDVFIKIRKKGRPDDVGFVIDTLEFESNRDDYDVLETRYLVCWKPDPRAEAQLLNIDPDKIHTVIAQ